LVIAKGTPGFSGADLANIVNEAALYAARENRKVVIMENFEKAKDKIMMGAERRSMVMSEKEKKNTAYHEAGHCIVGHLVPDHDPVYKVTIIPRGRALGVTMYLPEEDRHSMSRQALLSRIMSMFGGRIAEEITLGSEGVTTGASNDIQQATNLARKMVTKWGLSQKLGPLMYDDENEEVFLGMSAGHNKSHLSEETSRMIDEEIRSIIDGCYVKAEQILKDNIDILHAMAEALLEYETLFPEQIKDLMDRKKPRPPEERDDKSDPRSSLPPSAEQNPPRADGPVGDPAGEH